MYSVLTKDKKNETKYFINNIRQINIRQGHQSRWKNTNPNILSILDNTGPVRITQKAIHQSPKRNMQCAGQNCTRQNRKDSKKSDFIKRCGEKQSGQSNAITLNVLAIKIIFPESFTDPLCNRIVYFLSFF